MSLQLAAQHLASKGRGPDSMLVHMAPGEVKSLQELARAHGGTLTTNPDTGLPEAGFLSAILPIVAGAALGPAGAGLFSSALTAGLGVGAATGLATGSLRKGLMAGLGAYGGAGLMGSVTGAGANAASNMAGAEAAAAGDLAAQQAVVPSGVAAAPMNTGLAPVIDPASADFGGAMFTGPAPAGPTVMNSPFIAEPGTALAPRTVSYETMKAAGLGDEAIRQSAADYASNVAGTSQGTPFTQATREALASPTTTGIKAIVDKPSLLLNKENLKYGLAAAAPIASYMMEPKKQAPIPRDTEQYRYAYSAGPAMPPTRMGDVGEYTYFRPSYTRLAAEGGMMNELPVQRMSDKNEAEELMANGGQMYAKGGISHLGDYSDGGRLLRGPGDGVSDSIPATIANKRPARLADGEFVVPARIVSELGNGSTEAGARKLYAMMNRVQQRRAKTVGKGKVAVNSRAEKLLPA